MKPIDIPTPTHENFEPRPKETDRAVEYAQQMLAKVGGNPKKLRSRITFIRNKVERQMGSPYAPAFGESIRDGIARMREMKRLMVEHEQQQQRLAA